ncbi:MAG: transcriptional repressor [Candidatus Neomarinimicrobiota bacterium]
MTTQDLEEFKSALREEKLRFTPQRYEVFKEVCASKEHREADEIFAALRNRDVHVSRATVYRTMDILLKHDFVQRMNIGDGRWRYEHWLDCSHHDHLICVKCGRIVEFLSSEIEELQEKICSEFNYELLRHVHQLFGVCEECIANER